MNKDKRAVVYRDMVCCARTQEVLVLDTRSANEGLVWCAMHGYVVVTVHR